MRGDCGRSPLHSGDPRGSGRPAKYLCPMAERITVAPNRMRGLPCIRETRITVSAVLGQLAAGASIDDVLADYPCLEREDVLAALEIRRSGCAGVRAGSRSASGVKLFLDANFSPRWHGSRISRRLSHKPH
jgi:uncharacterized protein (DUF433 family)